MIFYVRKYLAQNKKRLVLSVSLKISLKVYIEFIQYFKKPLYNSMDNTSITFTISNVYAMYSFWILNK